MRFKTSVTGYGGFYTSEISEVCTGRERESERERYELPYEYKSTVINL
jgi:hypothetical protein